MSKTFREILPILAAAVLILKFFTFAAAQDVDIRIKISADSPSIAEIEGKFLSSKPRKNPRNLSFLNEYGAATGLAERISNLELTDRDGHPIANKRFIAGEYVADADFTGWKYRVNLTPPKQQSAAAHVSWIKGDVGLLMLDDLLPQSDGEKVSARVKIELPDAWNVDSGEVHIGDVSLFISDLGYSVADVEKGSFPISKDLRWKAIASNGAKLHLFISEKWQFTDDEAANLATEIYENYKKVFGTPPNRFSQISIMKFPNDVAIGNWEADTRGNSITIVSSDMPFKTQSLQRLHEQLRHEVFHLWIPNGVNLSGNYDWFYEGFALYQSLKLGVAVNRIRFEDFLDTLSRAYTIDDFQSQRISLIDASKNRWNGSNTQVYARGMLVAFLCDLALLENSKGKSSTDDLVRELYQKYHSAPVRQDGNTAVLELFRGRAELRPIADRYIAGAEKIDWRAALAATGIAAVTENAVTTLKVTAKPSGRQKDLLNKLGYNNWRKLTGNNR